VAQLWSRIIETRSAKSFAPKHLLWGVVAFEKLQQVGRSLGCSSRSHGEDLLGNGHGW
jgi:hypothetical protein